MVIPGRIIERSSRLQARHIVVCLCAQHVVPDMIRHYVNDHLNAKRMRRVHQLLQLLFSPEVRVGAVRVLNVVSVIGSVLAGAVVVTVGHLRFSDWRNPDCGISHVGDIGELVDHALPVSALHIAEVILRGLTVTDCVAGRIVRGIPIIEPVDHDLINRVVLCYCTDACGFCLRRC
ncbi:hypothetical protein D3C73_1119570 [compost metagenome]